jgi:hypothetical protein
MSNKLRAIKYSHTKLGEIYYREISGPTFLDPLFDRSIEILEIVYISKMVKTQLLAFNGMVIDSPFRSYKDRGWFMYKARILPLKDLILYSHLPHHSLRYYELIKKQYLKKDLPVGILVFYKWSGYCYIAEKISKTRWHDIASTDTCKEFGWLSFTEKDFLRISKWWKSPKIFSRKDLILYSHWRNKSKRYYDLLEEK